MKQFVFIPKTGGMLFIGLILNQNVDLMHDSAISNELFSRDSHSQKNTLEPMMALFEISGQFRQSYFCLCGL